VDAQQSYDLASPDDDEHRQLVEDRKQATKDEKFDEWENSHGSI
jgi:hypothetical protein